MDTLSWDAFNESGDLIAQVQAYHRRFTLDRIMAKLAETFEAVILVSFIVMNLEKLLSGILLSVLRSYGFLRIDLIGRLQSLSQCKPWAQRTMIGPATAPPKAC